MFNPAYYPARVGDSVLIGLKDSCIGIADAKNNDSKNSDAKNSIGNAKTGAAKNNDENAKNSIDKNDKQRVSPRPLLGQIGKPAASAGLVPLKPFDAKNPLVSATPSQTYFITRKPGRSHTQRAQAHTGKALKSEQWQRPGF